MALSGEVLNFLANTSEIDVRLLFRGDLEFDTNTGLDSTNVFRYALDNAPDDAPFQYDGQTWHNFPFQTEDFIRKVNQVSNPIEVIMYDPSSYNLPGPMKNLLEDTRVLHRTTFTLLMVFMDQIPNSNPPKYFYEDTNYTVTLFKGKLNSPSATESMVNLGMITQFDVLKDEVPTVTYSSTCPYITGDKLCVLMPTQLSVNNKLDKTVDIASDGLTVTVHQTPTEEDPELGLIKINNQVVENYWSLGAIIFKDNGLEGYAKSIVKCEVLYNKYVLTLESQVPTYGSNFEVILHANCTKEFSDCKGRFGNEDNFGGQRSLIRVVGGSNIPLRDV